MTLKKWFRLAFIFSAICSIIGLIYYFNLSNRHKAIVKTRLLHFFHIIDSDWSTKLTPLSIEIESPSFLIDGIYKSMEGPKAVHYFQADKVRNDLLWMTGFQVTALSQKSKDKISNDFICHTNINYIEQEHHDRWNLKDRINLQYPRLISLSHGIESMNFPEGYGFPFFANEKFFLITQSLNHNISDSIFQLKHHISIKYKSDRLKTLMPKTVYMQIPFSKEQIKDSEIGKIEMNTCIPVETKNHTYTDDQGNLLSGHWKINLGKQEFKSNITDQLSLKDTLRVHQITPHLHPFAETFALRDITTNNVLFNCKVINHKNKIGLSRTPAFSSIEGILLYPDHEYELLLRTNNTTNEIQDMMASMFMFFYDDEMADKINNYKTKSEN